VTGLLAEAIAAHGGAERWAQISELRWDMSAWGALFVAKRARVRLPRYEARLWTREPRAVFAPYPGPGRRGVFTLAEVRIETDAGDVVAQRSNPRAAFNARRLVWWDHLDLLHFAGYATWAYATAPFLFAQPSFATREIEPSGASGALRRRLAVTFPADLPAHSREQVFHVDDDGTLRRNDYTAEVVGRWARAAHQLDGYREFGGIRIPTRRRVRPRLPNGRAAPFPTLVALRIHDAQVVTERVGGVGGVLT